MLKKLAASIREYKKISLITPIFTALEVVMEVIIPLLLAKLIDEGVNVGSMPMIYKVGLELILAAVLSLTFGIIAAKLSAKAANGFAKNLRHDMYYKVQNYSFSNIDKFSTSSIVTRLTTDVTNVQQSYQMMMRIVIRAPLMLIFSLIMAFSINRKLSLIFLGIIPILVIGLFAIMKKVHPIFESVFKTYDRLNTVVQENVKGIRVVKAFVTEEKEKKKFKNVSEEIYNKFTKAEKLLILNNPLMQFASYSALILISWFAAHFIVAGDLTTGQLTSLITYTTQILMSLMMISMVFVMLTMSRASGERIAEILSEESDLQNPEKPILKVEDGSIIFKDVDFSYVKDKNKLCLENINLEIKSGETIGIIGGTGSSKSTFVQLIPRLYDVTDGEVLVGGKNVKEYDIEALRNEVSMVLQKNELFSGTIKENLRWGDENATDEQIEHACKLAQAHDFIVNFPNGYDTYIEQGGTNVSGGQKQRLCIARALLKKPKILILDDSTSAVDTKTDSLIRTAFREEIPNTTKLIIAQRIASVQDADKILVLDNGKINGFGTHEELLENNEIYKDVYYSQNRKEGV